MRAPKRTQKHLIIGYCLDYSVKVKKLFCMQLYLWTSSDLLASLAKLLTLAWLRQWLMTKCWQGRRRRWRRRWGQLSAAVHWPGVFQALRCLGSSLWTTLYALRRRLRSLSPQLQVRDGKEPSFIGFGSVRVLWVPGFGSGSCQFFKWRVLVLSGFFDYHGSVQLRVLLGNVTFIWVIIYKLTINVFLKLQDCWV